MRLAFIMMQKNEVVLLEPWIRYHASLAGIENLFIFDNGSTEPLVHRVLRRAEIEGAQVFRQYSRSRDYLHRGEIVGDLIKKLDRESPYDFYFPMDCDEFIACDSATGPAVEKQDIFAGLLPYRDRQEVLTISHKYVANPCRKDWYSIMTTSEKCFFTKDSCAWLDGGFHRGRSKFTDEREVTGIVYVEFHFRPYRSHRFFCRQKLATRSLADYSRKSLKAYADRRGSSHHCAADLLQGKYDYLQKFLRTDDLVFAPGVFMAFDALGIKKAGLFESMPPIPLPAYLYILRLRQAAGKRFEPLVEILQSAARLAKRAARRLRRLWTADGRKES